MTYTYNSGGSSSILVTPNGNEVTLSVSGAGSVIFYGPLTKNNISEHFIIDLTNFTSTTPANESIWFYGDSYYQGDTDPAIMDTFSFVLPQGWTLTNNYVYGNPPPPPPGRQGTYFTLTDENGNLVTTSVWVPADPSFITICFTSGARLLMEDGGEKVIDDIHEGDMVQTQDGTARPVRWVGSSPVTSATLEQFANRRPIVFRKGALGDHEEFRVSPQHRILVDKPVLLEQLGIEKGLVRAKHLVNDHSILVDNSLEEVQYFHLMFDKHEVVCADGIWSESFYPGKYALSAVEDEVRDEIIFHFPELEYEPAQKTYGDHALPLLNRKHVKKLGSSL